MKSKSKISESKSAAQQSTAAPVGREQECKKAATVTGAGETSVHHADLADDFDFGSESDFESASSKSQVQPEK